MSTTSRSHIPRESSRPQGRPIRIVPLRGERGAPAPSLRLQTLPSVNLTYRHGPLLTAVEIVSVYWGSDWNDAANRQLMQGLNSFFRFVVTSPYIDQLDEYSVPDRTIEHGSFTGTVIISDVQPGKSVTDSAIQQLVDTGVTRKTLPAPTPNSLYFVFAPPGVTVVAGKDESCQSFCGYHDRSGGKHYYAAVPFPGCAGCLADLTPLDALTAVCSHELAEAVTEPVPGTGWYDDANGEVADICAWQNKKLGGYEVQLLWSNRAKQCA
jgi:hypothetical protein